MNIRCAIADGWIDQHDNIAGWRDTLIFREELRAIGHRMAADGSDLALLDFGSFWELLRNDPKGAEKRDGLSKPRISMKIWNAPMIFISSACA